MRVLLALVILSFFLSASAYASSIKVTSEGNSKVSVEQKVEGESTICVNGKCETTGGESSSEVCVNGKCYESNDGNLEVNEGNTKININNSNGSNSVSVENSTSGSDNSVKVNSNSTNSQDKDVEDEDETIPYEDKNEEKEELGTENKRFFETFIDLLKKLLPFI